MSKPLAVIDNTSIVTLPASSRKLITGINCAGVITTILPPELKPDDTVRTRNIKLSYDMAHSAITGQKSALALIQGLAFCAVAFSHGNKNLEQLQAGAPDWVKATLANVCSLFKAGAGNVTVTALKEAVQIAIDKALTLPAPAAKAKTLSTPAIQPAIVVSSQVDDGMTEKDIDRRNLSADIADKRAGDNLLAATTAHALSVDAQKLEIVKIADDKRASESQSVVSLVCEMSDKDQAVMLVRAMAAHFGFTLVNMGLPVRIAA